MNDIIQQETNGVDEILSSAIEALEGDEATKKAEKEERLFTQKDVDRFVAKKLKSMPSKEELIDYREWKSMRPQLEEKVRILEAEKTRLEKTALLNRYGVDSAYHDFLMASFDNDFEESLKDYLKTRGGFVKKMGEVTMTMGHEGSGTTLSRTEIMSDLLRKINQKLDV